MGISVGIVGLGAFGSEFVDLFFHHPLVDRIALCDREPKKLAEFAQKESLRKKFDPSDAYESLAALCRSDIQCVALFTQHWLHAIQAVEAMEAGKHVYSAVPVLCRPDGDEILEWCDRLVETCVRTGQHYMFGETTYYRPEAQFCRRQAAAGAFGDFMYAEGEYIHDVDSGYNLRDVIRWRLSSTAGREWAEELKRYDARGIIDGPMHYPTHSTSGPISVMKAHAVRVWALPWYNRAHDEFFGKQPSNETALFAMSNGACMRICEHRDIGHPGREMFRVYGTKGSFEHEQWCERLSSRPVPEEEMRDPLPPEVEAAYEAGLGRDRFRGGHGGSHAYLIHEFVSAIAADRRPVINAWEAVRYMVPGVMAHKSALRDGEVLEVPDWGDAP